MTVDKDSGEITRIAAKTSNNVKADPAILVILLTVMNSNFPRTIDKRSHYRGTAGEKSGNCWEPLVVQTTGRRIGKIGGEPYWEDLL